MTVENGLPGEHHFYITFRTDHPEVRIPSHLKAQHPEDMTIVLQHQFWDLEVTEDWFAVALSFQGKRELLHVPFESVTAFADPFAKFGLQFQTDLDGDDMLDDDDAFDDEDGASVFTSGEAGAVSAAPGAEADADGDNVVTLDAFRKK